MKYYEKIDGLRFVAIFLVLLQHFAPIIGARIFAGFYGVDLFFVISGFLITSILLQPNKKTFKTNYTNFIGRRTLRIFPIYYLTILILWLLNLDIIKEKLIWFLTYTYNYACVLYNLPGSPVTHFWSLSVEEQFYLFWPIVVLSLKNNYKQLITLIAAIIILAYTQYVFNIFPSLSAYNYAGLLTRMGSLGLGALGAVLTTQDLLPDKLFKSKLFECIVFLVLIFSLAYWYKFQPLVLGLCSFYLVVKAAGYNFYIKPVSNFLTNKFVIRIGTLSYGIYIFHGPIAYYIGKYILKPTWANIDFASLGFFAKLKWHSWIIKFSLYSSLSILVAWLSFKYIEKPILKLKDKWFRY